MEHFSTNNDLSLWGRKYFEASSNGNDAKEVQQKNSTRKQH